MTPTNTAIPTGLSIQSQIPLDNKGYFLSESILSDLGTDDELAYTYYKGMIVYCALENTSYKWKEIEEGELGFLSSNFIYPDEWIKEGIDYSNKIYNFIQIVQSLDVLQRIDEGSGNGIIIRGRNPNNYGPIGFNAVDLSFSNDDEDPKGAVGARSFTEGYNTYCTAIGGHAEGVGTSALGNNSGTHAEGFNSTSQGAGAHCEGYGTEADGDGTHSEGSDTRAINQYAHAENKDTLASGIASHAQNKSTISSGDYSDATGLNSVASSLAETSIGHNGTVATGSSNTFILTDRLFTIGNGIDQDNKSDALLILKSGLTSLPSTTIPMITAGTGKTVVTKEFLIEKINEIVIPVEGKKQKVLDYPDDFTGINYTFTDSDDEYLIFINNGSTNVTLTVPNGLLNSFFVAVIQEDGSGDVSFVESGTTIKATVGNKIKGQRNAVALDKKGSTEIFYLTGNNKA